MTFAGVATILAILSTGGVLPTVYGAVIAASLIGLAIAPFFSRIIRFFPPVVTGCVITMIGISLTPVAIRWIMGGNPKAENWGDPANVGLAALTLAIVLIFSMLRSVILRRLAILVAIVLGTLFAWGMGFTDFSKVAVGPVFAVPNLFHFGLPVFEVTAILSMLIVTLVIMTETTADIIALGEIVGTPVDAKRIGDGIRADMLSSAISPLFGSFSQSAFAQNVGLVAITGVKSRFVVVTAGGILIVLGLLPIVGRLVASIPMPVLGGAGIVLFGTVAASGIRTLVKVDYSENTNLIIVATSLAIGMIPIVHQVLKCIHRKWYSILLHHYFCRIHGGH